MRLFLFWGEGGGGESFNSFFFLGGGCGAGEVRFIWFYLLFWIGGSGFIVFVAAGRGCCVKRFPGVFSVCCLAVEYKG